MAYPTYTEPTLEQAQASPEYGQLSSSIDAQGALNERSYEQNRQDIINLYQSSLDAINLGLKGAGIRARGQYASRNLYNASGDLSGTGEIVGSELTQPYLADIKNLQAGTESSLAKLGTSRDQSRLNLQNSRMDALQGILSNLRTSAKKRYDAEVDAYNAGVDTQNAQAKAVQDYNKLPGSRAYQEARGYQYLGTTKAVASARAKYGADSVVNIGGKLFLLPAKERLDLANTKSIIASRNKPKSTPKNTGSLTADEKGFYADIDKAQADLRNGATWGEVWNKLSSKWGAPADVLDQLLNKDFWAQPGAYENFKAGR